MRRSSVSVWFVCPNCQKPVDSTKPNAMMSAATNSGNTRIAGSRARLPFPPIHRATSSDDPSNREHAPQTAPDMKKYPATRAGRR
jgi:hypothetical protein